MYLRPCSRTKEGQRHADGAWVESDRTARGPRPRVVSWLGALDDRGRPAVKRRAPPAAAVPSARFAESAPEWVEVERKRVRVERSRRFGGRLYRALDALLPHQAALENYRKGSSAGGSRWSPSCCGTPSRACTRKGEPQAIRWPGAAMRAATDRLASQ
jgi:hypothetical protein